MGFQIMEPKGKIKEREKNFWKLGVWAPNHQIHWRVGVSEKTNYHQKQRSYREEKRFSQKGTNRGRGKGRHSNQRKYVDEIWGSIRGDTTTWTHSNPSLGGRDSTLRQRGNT